MGIYGYVSNKTCKLLGSANLVQYEFGTAKIETKTTKKLVIVHSLIVESNTRRFKQKDTMVA